MSKSLCISAAIAMALSAAAAHSAQSECQRLKVGPARTACMQSNIRPDGLDAEMVGRSIGHGVSRPGPATTAGTPDIAPPTTAGIDAAAVGGTSGAAAQAEGHMNLRSSPEITHGSPKTPGAARP